MKLPKKLLFGLNEYVLDRYGGWRKLIVTYVAIRFFLIRLAQLLFYLTEEETKTLPVDQNEEQKLTRREKLKRFLRKGLLTRGGQIPSSVIFEVAKVLSDSTAVLSLILMCLRPLKFQDLQVSVYDLYLRTAILQGESENSCRSVDSLFSYLFTILQDDQLSLDPEQKMEKIYNQLFDNNKLKQNSKNNKHIVLFLTCSILFLIQFAKSGTTFDGFFMALIKAIKNGKISKAVVRRLIYRLEQRNIPYPQELLEVIK